MIRLKGCIKHDGEVYETGDLIELDDLSEKRLIALGMATKEGEICEDPSSFVTGVNREDLEEQYKKLGGRPQEDWSLEKLLEKLEERKRG